MLYVISAEEKRRLSHVFMLHLKGNSNISVTCSCYISRGIQTSRSRVYVTFQGEFRHLSHVFMLQLKGNKDFSVTCLLYISRTITTSQSRASVNHQRNKDISVTCLCASQDSEETKYSCITL